MIRKISERRTTETKIKAASKTQVEMRVIRFILFSVIVVTGF